MLVQQIMTVNPVTVDAADTLEHVERVLCERDVRHVPVLARGVLAGMISDRDLGLFRADREACARTSAGQVMSLRLLTVEPTAELSVVVDALLESKVGALLVVDPRNNSLVGIVSYIDILRAVRDQV